MKNFLSAHQPGRGTRWQSGFLVSLLFLTLCFVLYPGGMLAHAVDCSGMLTPAVDCSECHGRTAAAYNQEAAVAQEVAPASRETGEERYLCYLCHYGAEYGQKVAASHHGYYDDPDATPPYDYDPNDPTNPYHKYNPFFPSEPKGSCGECHSVYSQDCTGGYIGLQGVGCGDCHSFDKCLYNVWKFPRPACQNQTPILNPIGNKVGVVGVVGQLLTFVVTGSDPEGQTLTFSDYFLPLDATFEPETATFSWTPGSEQDGVYQNVAFMVEDNGIPVRADREFITVAIGKTYPPPVAGFTRSPTSGVAPLSVNFTDASIGTISGWLWDFGDGGTSTDQNPSHVYADPGTYTVSLTVTGPEGSSTKTKSGYILVYVPSVADFVGSPTTGVAPLLTVNFTDASTGAVTGWAWDFGDGGTSTLKNPSHGYAAGSYTVSLTVTGPGGSDSEVKAGYITVYATLTVTKAGTGSGTVTSSPPGISCGTDCSEPYAGTVVTLTATADTDSLFAGWSGGGCSGTGTCQVTMNADKAVTATFTQYITVTVPNGGESWTRGTTQTISWTYADNPGSKVKIELLKGGAVNMTITPMTSIGSNGSGSYSWKIPKKQATGSDYQIRITSTSNSNYNDTSNEIFTITP